MALYVQSATGWHAPPLHVAPLPHACAHLPQLFASVCSSTHVAPHRVSLVEHAHAPFCHVVPPVHVVRSEQFPVRLLPQYVSFVSGSTHEPPQISVLMGHSQLPPTHWYVEFGHAMQAFPP